MIILGAARTPFGKFGGALRDISVAELGSLAVCEALRRAGVSGQEVDEVAIGVNLPGSDRSIARQIALRAGIPDDRSAYTVDRACCSSLTALTMAVRSVRAGEAGVAVAGGAENMSRVPYFLSDMRWGHRLGNVTLVDQLVISCPHTHVPRAIQAADEAGQYGIDRAEQDAWALRSQQLHAAARARGAFDDELFPLDLAIPESEGIHLAADEAPRPGTTAAGLAALPTIYGSSTVTAGNAPGMGRGASALVVTSGALAQRRGSMALGGVVATAMASGPPANITSIPAVAAMAVLAKAQMDLDQVDLIEINEAFAAVPLVTTLLLAGRDRRRAERIRERVNVNGGAIAVGHPTGATAARLIMTLVFELRRRGGGIGLVTICGGVGEGEAALVRVPA